MPAVYTTDAPNPVWVVSNPSERTITITNNVMTIVPNPGSTATFMVSADGGANYISVVTTCVLRIFGGTALIEGATIPLTLNRNVAATWVVETVGGGSVAPGTGNATEFTAAVNGPETVVIAATYNGVTARHTVTVHQTDPGGGPSFVITDIDITQSPYSLDYSLNIEVESVDAEDLIFQTVEMSGWRVVGITLDGHIGVAYGDGNGRVEIPGVTPVGTYLATLLLERVNGSSEDTWGGQLWVSAGNNQGAPATQAIPFSMDHSVYIIDVDEGGIICGNSFRVHVNGPTPENDVVISPPEAATFTDTGFGMIEVTVADGYTGTFVIFDTAVMEELQITTLPCQPVAPTITGGESAVCNQVVTLQTNVPLPTWEFLPSNAGTWAGDPYGTTVHFVPAQGFSGEIVFSIAGTMAEHVLEVSCSAVPVHVSASPSLAQVGDRITITTDSLLVDWRFGDNPEYGSWERGSRLDLPVITFTVGMAAAGESIWFSPDGVNFAYITVSAGDGFIEGPSEISATCGQTITLTTAAPTPAWSIVPPSEGGGIGGSFIGPTDEATTQIKIAFNFTGTIVVNDFAGTENPFIINVSCLPAAVTGPGSTQCGAIVIYSANVPTPSWVITPPTAAAIISTTGPEATIRIADDYMGSVFYLSADGGNTQKTVGVSCCQLPKIISQFVVRGAVGAALAYQIGATANPTVFAAFNLPPGMSINSQTGLVSGVPTSPGNWITTVSAANSCGSARATVSFAIQMAAGGLPNWIVLPAGTDCNDILKLISQTGIAYTSNPLGSPTDIIPLCTGSSDLVLDHIELSMTQSTGDVYGASDQDWISGKSAIVVNRVPFVMWWQFDAHGRYLATDNNGIEWGVFIDGEHIATRGFRYTWVADGEVPNIGDSESPLSGYGGGKMGVPFINLAPGTHQIELRYKRHVNAVQGRYSKSRPWTASFSGILFAQSCGD